MTEEPKGPTALELYLMTIEEQIHELVKQLKDNEERKDVLIAELLKWWKPPGFVN
jgi:hypothetical protein